MQLHTRQSIYFEGFWVLSIAILSFRLYSYVYYPLLNSDDALNVLMADSYSLPHDIYCWGQDRGGTLIPLLAQPFLWVGMPAIWAVSVVTYGLLFVGYVGARAFLAYPFARIVFAVLWFLPYHRFVDLTRFPIGMSYCLLLAGWAILYNLRIQPQRNTRVKIGFAFLCFGLAIWVSDVALFSVAVSIILGYFFRNKWPASVRKNMIVYTITLAVCMLVFLLYAKSHAMHTAKGYASINSVPELWQAINIICHEIFMLATAWVTEPLSAAFVCAALVLFLGCLVISLRIRNHFKIHPIFILFGTDAIFIFVLFIASHWVFLNNMGRWYFVATYISTVLFFLILMERTATSNLKVVVKMLFVFVATVGAVSSIVYMQTRNPGHLTAAAQPIQELDALAPLYIIGNYWHAYILSVQNPKQIFATPNDAEEVRNPRIVHKIVAQPFVYMVGTNWLPQYPRQMQQFGHVYRQEGVPFTIAGRNMCRYAHTCLPTHKPTE